MIKFWLSLILSLLAFNCASPTGPGLAPGRRDYVWTVDTIQMTVNHLSTMWGSSSTDIWAGGRGGLATDRLLHYDGHQWTPWKEPILTGVNTLFGFSTNNVWLGGNDGRIWHFDGNHWGQNFAYAAGTNEGVIIQDIYGDNSDNVFAVGVAIPDYDDRLQRGFILHFDGASWTQVYRASYYSQFGRVRVGNGKTFIWGIRPSNTASDTESIYLYDSYTLKEIYSGVTEAAGQAMIDEIGGQDYFILSHAVCRYVYEAQTLISGQIVARGRFIPVFSVVHPNFNYGVTGRSLSDAFLLMRDGLAHWNGSNINYLVTYSPNDIYGSEPVMFSDDIFFCAFGLSSGGSFVYHGTLRE